eukprot:TRINITY_DN2538_c3_g1_i2.p1 TRINITY_DN2538_c3_g1~~TRINITY_DN2538_c3_g1_i2.p1  ORF type:complete len:1170 (+),score=221.31 TRINITY_DN2538_c3_g1_i2:480-3512(+)
MRLKWMEGVSVGRTTPAIAEERYQLLRGEFLAERYNVLFSFSRAMCEAVGAGGIPEWVAGGKPGLAMAAIGSYVTERRAAEEAPQGEDSDEALLLAEQRLQDALPECVAEGLIRTPCDDLLNGVGAVNTILGSRGEDAQSWIRIRDLMRSLPEEALKESRTVSAVAEAFLLADDAAIRDLTAVLPHVEQAVGDWRKPQPGQMLTEKDAKAVHTVWGVVTRMPRDVRVRLVESVALPESVSPVCASLAKLSGDECDSLSEQILQLPQLHSCLMLLRDRYTRDRATLTVGEGPPSESEQRAADVLRELLSTARVLPADAVLASAPLAGASRGSGHLIGFAGDVGGHFSEDDLIVLVRGFDAAAVKPMPKATEDGCLGNTPLGNLYAAVGVSALRKKGQRPPPPEVLAAVKVVAKAQLLQLVRWWRNGIVRADHCALIFTGGVALIVLSVAANVVLLLDLYFFPSVIASLLIVPGLVVIAVYAADASYACATAASAVYTHVPALRRAAARAVALSLLSVATACIIQGTCTAVLLAIPAALLFVGGAIEACVAGNAQNALDALYSKGKPRVVEAACECMNESGELHEEEVGVLLGCGRFAARDALVAFGEELNSGVVSAEEVLRWWENRSASQVLAERDLRFEWRTPAQFPRRVVAGCSVLAGVWGLLSSVLLFVILPRPQGLLCVAAVLCCGVCATAVACAALSVTSNMHGRQRPVCAGWGSLKTPLGTAVCLCLLACSVLAVIVPTADSGVVLNIVVDAQLIVGWAALCGGALGVYDAVHPEEEEEEDCEVASGYWSPQATMKGLSATASLAGSGDASPVSVGPMQRTWAAESHRSTLRTGAEAQGAVVRLAAEAAIPQSPQTVGSSDRVRSGPARGGESAGGSTYMSWPEEQPLPQSTQHGHSIAADDSASDAGTPGTACQPRPHDMSDAGSMALSADSRQAPERMPLTALGASMRTQAAVMPLPTSPRLGGSCYVRQPTPAADEEPAAAAEGPAPGTAAAEDDLGPYAAQ